jgi:hypothetical protein
VQSIATHPITRHETEDNVVRGAEHVERHAPQIA